MDFAGEEITKQNASNDCYLERRAVLEDIVNIHEIFSISTLICALCFQLIKPAQGKKAKKKPDSKVRECLVELCDQFKQCVVQLDCNLERWRPSDNRDLSDRLAALNLDTDGQTAVINHLDVSLSMAVRDLRTILKAKVKFLYSLH